MNITEMSDEELLEYANETQKYFDDNDVEFLKTLDRYSDKGKEYEQMCYRRFAINYVMAKRLNEDF